MSVQNCTNMLNIILKSTVRLWFHSGCPADLDSYGALAYLCHLRHQLTVAMSHAVNINKSLELKCTVMKLVV